MSAVHSSGQTSGLAVKLFRRFSDAEVARILDISNATVSYRKKDALRRLRALMEAMNHEK